MTDLARYYDESYPPSLWADPPDPPASPAGGPATPAHVNPAGYTIAQVQAYVDANPDLADETLAAEQARGDQARVTLVDWLQGFISHRDEGTLPAFMGRE